MIYAAINRTGRTWVVCREVVEAGWRAPVRVVSRHRSYRRAWDMAKYVAGPGGCVLDWRGRFYRL